MLTLLTVLGPELGRGDEAGGATTPDMFSHSSPSLRPHLAIDLPANVLATSGILVLSGLSQLEAHRLAQPHCNWCEPPQVDRWARRELRWADVAPARTASDILVVAIPAGAALTLSLSARSDGAGTREVVEDLLMLTEAASTAVLLSQASKFATGRLRPDAWASGGDATTDARMSFWGGHAAFAFSVAAAATQVSRLRGRSGWKWIALASFAGATATAWLRVGADRHWLTDVVAGAGVGTAAGLAVPLLVLRPAGERTTAVTLVPAPGGLALLF